MEVDQGQLASLVESYEQVLYAHDQAAYQYYMVRTASMSLNRKLAHVLATCRSARVHLVHVG
jgi:hypothetical protein